jgi:hypothetical protein
MKRRVLLLLGLIALLQSHQARATSCVESPSGVDTCDIQVARDANTFTTPAVNAITLLDNNEGTLSAPTNAVGTLKIADLAVTSSTENYCLLYGASGELCLNDVCEANTACTGYVSSVGLSMPAEFSVANSPVTSSGTLTVTEATQSANTVYAGPTSGGATAPGFRTVVDNDVPDTITVNAAAALTANGANCSAGAYPKGVDASGAAESCTAVSLTADVSGVLPVANGGTNNGSLGDSPTGQVLRMVSGQVVNQTVPQAAITTGFDLFVDVLGTDSATCGPINDKCKTLTGANGAHAKITANNDNGFATCTNDTSAGCGRCSGGSNNGTSCNDDGDCTGGGICSSMTCSASSSTACNKVCSVTTGTKCDRDLDCPTSETCSGADTCGGGTCSVSNTNSRCASGGCAGPQKRYVITLGAGTFIETLSGSGAPPSPGSILYRGADQFSTEIRSDASCLLDLSNRKLVVLRDLFLNQTGNGDAVCSTGGMTACGSSGKLAVIHQGTGWDFNITGTKNTTNTWDGVSTQGYGPTASDRSIHFENWQWHCSTTTSRACAVDGDCPGGETCLQESSSDWGYFNTFIQPGKVSSGDAAILVEAKACGTPFNMLLDRVTLQAPYASGTTGSTGLKLVQSTCDASSPAGLKNALRIGIRDVQIVPNDNLVSGYGGPHTAIDVGSNTSIAPFGSGLHYDACRRKVSGTIQYVDASAGTTDAARRWGGGSAYLGPIECDAPQTPAVASPGITSVTFATSGGTIVDGTYYYKVTATNALGESLPSSALSVVTSACSSACTNTVNWAIIGGSTGYKVYGRPATAGGTYGLLTTISDPATITWADTGSGSPGAAPPVADTTFTANPKEGEIWFSTTATPPRYRVYQNAATNEVIDATVSSANTTWTLRDLAGTQRGYLKDVVSITQTQLLSQRNNLCIGTNSMCAITCNDNTNGTCTLHANAQTPTANGQISSKLYTDTHVHAAQYGGTGINTSASTGIPSIASGTWSVAWPTKSVAFSAAGYSVDGTQCTVPAERTINSGPKRYMVNCADNNGSIVYFDVGMPDSYSGSTLVFKLRAESEASSPSGNLQVDYSCQCVRSDDVISSTWGTAQSATVTFATQYKEQVAASAATTCSGTCAAGAHVYARGVVNATGTTTTMTNVYVLETTMEYPTNAATD